MNKKLFVKVMVEVMERRDFATMNDFMNHMSEEEYQQMLDAMSEYGYGDMAMMIKNIGREGMMEMHNSKMGGQRKCGFIGNMMWAHR